MDFGSDGPTGGGDGRTQQGDVSRGEALIESALQEMALQEDSHAVQHVHWDDSLAELSSAVKSRIPPVVEERVRRAQQRANCGLLAGARHAWASADQLLHIWDYRIENPFVHVIPADSVIICVAACQPKPGVFEPSVQLLLVLSTRLSVSLVGLRLPQGGSAGLLGGIARASLQSQAAAAAAATSGGFGGALAGELAGVPGATGVPGFPGGAGFPGAAAMADPGFIGGVGASVAAGSFPGSTLFGSMGPPGAAPGLATSQYPPLGMGGAGAPAAGGVMGGLQAPGAIAPYPPHISGEVLISGAEDHGVGLVPLDGYRALAHGALFHAISCTADGHILLACGAPQVYELAYARTGTWLHSKCRLVRHALGVWGRVKELWSITPLTSKRIRVLTCASHSYAVTVDDRSSVRLFGVRDSAPHKAECSAHVEELANLSMGDLANQVLEFEKEPLAVRILTHAFVRIGLDGHVRCVAVTAASNRLVFLCSWDEPPAGPDGKGVRTYGFRLQHASKAPLSHGGTTSTSGAGAGVLLNQPRTGLMGFADSLLFGESASVQANQGTCLEEHHEPCAHSHGIWFAAAHRPGVTVTEVGVTVRIDDLSTAASSDAPGAPVSMSKSLTFDSPVLDIVEECEAWAVDPTLAFTGTSQALHEILRDGQPSAFRVPRTFAILLQGSVQVFRMTFKAPTLHREPATEAECCLHLVGLALPAASPAGSLGSAGILEPVASRWPWSFHDVRIPSVEEQQRAWTEGLPLPMVHHGIWFGGLKRFVGILLRPVWEQPLVAAIRGRHLVDRRPHGDGLCLALSEGAVRSLLARIKPVVHFVRVALAGAEPQAQGVLSVPTTAAARRRLYASRTVTTEALWRATSSTRALLEVASRAQETLGLLSILHKRRCAFRVLQSPALTGPALDALLQQPLRSFIAKPEAMAPIVQLSTALVVESGLTTPAAELVFDSRSFPRPPGAESQLRTGGAPGVPARQLGPGELGDFSSTSSRGDAVCHELEALCPDIFAQVDLAYVRARLGKPVEDRSSAPAEVGGELLRRYAQCVSSASEDTRWDQLAVSLQSMAKDNPRGAMEICVDKLQQLQSSDPATAMRHARLLLDAFLENVGLTEPQERTYVDHALTARAIVESLLRKTSSLRLGEVQSTIPLASAGHGCCAEVHGIIIDFFLARPHRHDVLEALLDTAATDVHALLMDRFRSGEERQDSGVSLNRFAGEFLWKLLLRLDRTAEASKVLLELAERTDIGACTLQQRIECLDRARQAASKALPQSREVMDKLADQPDAAVRVQAPLGRELEVLIRDDRTRRRWREAAERRQALVQSQLVGLQDLYNIAIEFGFFHLVLVIMDVSPETPDRATVLRSWVQVFFPPLELPYSPTQMDRPPALREHGAFPLLMVRPCTTFLVESAAEALPEAASARAELFQSRALRFLEEMSVATRVPNAPLWDLRLIATLLEYCSCLWMKLVGDGRRPGASSVGNEPRPGGGLLPSRASPSPERTERRSQPRSFGDYSGAGGQPEAPIWVALRVLMSRSFGFNYPSVISFYSETLLHLPSWQPDLEAMLPADPTGLRPILLEDDLRKHLGEILADVIARWLGQVAHTSNANAVEEFRSTWPVMDGILADFVQPGGRDPQADSWQGALADKARSLRRDALQVIKG